MPKRSAIVSCDLYLSRTFAISGSRFLYLLQSVSLLSTYTGTTYHDNVDSDSNHLSIR